MGLSNKKSPENSPGLSKQRIGGSVHCVSPLIMVLLVRPVRPGASVWPVAGR